MSLKGENFWKKENTCIKRSVVTVQTDVIKSSESSRNNSSRRQLMNIKHQPVSGATVLVSSSGLQWHQMIYFGFLQSDIF